MSWYVAVGLSLIVPLLGALLLGGAYWRYGVKGALVAGSIVVLYICVSYLPHLQLEDKARHGSNMRLVFQNVRIFKTDVPEQARALAAWQGDVIALVEVRLGWPEQLRGDVFKDYPYRVRHTLGLNDGFDIVQLISRWPLTLVKAPWPFTKCDAEQGPALYRVEAPTPFHILLIHPLSPVHAASYAQRNQFLKMVAEVPLPENTVIIGDFNTVPWDPALWPLWMRKDVQLHLTWLPTYRTYLPLIPIDHVITRSAMQIHKIQRWFDGQSDHFGLVVDFQVKKASE